MALNYQQNPFPVNRLPRYNRNLKKKSSVFPFALTFVGGECNYSKIMDQQGKHQIYGKSKTVSRNKIFNLLVFF